jgi:nitrite reductase (NADH) large subunit
LVVIGTGMAGGRVVEEIVARDQSRFEITIFGAEPYTVYNRILLSDVLAGARSPEGVFLYSTEWFQERGVELITRARVEMIDRERKLLRLADGRERSYDKLVIATGSLPLVPEIENVNSPGVFVFRTIEDCQLISSYARRCKRAAVIGGGLLGLEAARGLLNHGLEVTVVEVMRYPMAQQLDEESGAMLTRRMEGLGLRFEFEKASQRVLGDTAVRGLAFKDGAEITTDMVVISCGIRPNVRLAVEAGLRVERGIVCNDRLATSDPDIFAVGECVEHAGRLYGLVAPLYDQARVLADCLTGSNPQSLYRGSKISTRLKVMGVDLVSVGDGRALDPRNALITKYVEPERGVYKKLVVRDGKLEGGILLGETDCANSLIAAYEGTTPLPDRHVDLLFGRAASDPAAVLKVMPSEANVCACHQVSKARLVELIGKGCSLDDLAVKTRAGTGCGGCKPQLELLASIHGGDNYNPSAARYVKSIPLSKPDLIAELRRVGLKSVSAVLAHFGAEDDPGAKPALASLLRMLWHEEYKDERDALFVNDRIHANIQNDGTFSVVPRIYGGVTSPAELRRIAEVAEKYRVRMVKITGGQRLDLLGIRKRDLPAVWRDLGMPSGHAYTKAFRTCKTCVGTDFCRYGVGDSTALGIAVEKRFQGIEAPHKMKLAASGCSRNCAESTVKDIGVVAVDGGWQIYVGGTAGSRVRAGDLLATLATQDEVLRMIGRFIQYYRMNARYMERTPAFIERIGIEQLRAGLVDDADGTAAQLDREIEAEIRTYRDPWLEGAAPVEPSQFREETSV